MPASSYYVLTGSMSVIVFFLIWAILIEGGEETPWISAGIAACLLLIAAVVVREVVMRNARNRYLAAKRRLDWQMNRLPNGVSRHHRSNKLSLQENEMMLGHIFKKSEAARVLGDLAGAHREVFRICDDYLVLTRKELVRTDVKSPRYIAIRKGRHKVKRLHRFHLLTWVEAESREVIESAREEASQRRRIERGGYGVSMLEEALRHYPSEKRLLESWAALKEFVALAEIADGVEKAEGAGASGDLDTANAIYAKLLEGLPEADLGDEDREVVRESIERKVADLNNE